MNIKPGEKIHLPGRGSWPESVHVFDEQSIWAVRAALASERPLLVRGEPGCGKSQLARAVAEVEERLFIAEVVHARSECQDLQWHFDAVRRLAEAQTLGTAGAEKTNTLLNPERFLSPGALWWAFNWTSAETQYQKCVANQGRPKKPRDWEPKKGCVVLIDEIDKAEADLPNGLLETLGNGAFIVPYQNRAVGLVRDIPPPLVVITTNEERELPAAFVRRCMVLHLKLPKEEGACIAWLMERGAVHFPRCGKDVRREAAVQLWGDRRKAQRNGWSPPGQAEYLDLLRAVCTIESTQKKQLAVLEKIRDFALAKHPGQGP